MSTRPATSRTRATPTTSPRPGWTTAAVRERSRSRPREPAPGFLKYQPYVGNEGGSAQAPGDYRLTASSPLVDRGSSASYPSLDFAGIARYLGNRPDVGGYESPNRFA